MRSRGFEILRVANQWSYRLMAFLFYPLNLWLSLLFRKKKGRGVLHISTVTHQPYLITRHLRALSFHADFMAKGEGWLYFNEEGKDFHMSHVRLPGPLKFLYELWWAWKLYPKYQIIHSHFLQMVGSGFWEIGFLKRMGKKIVFHFRGDDIRRKEVNLRLNPELNCCQECNYPDAYCHNPQRDFLVDIAKQYGDLFLVTTPDLNDFFPGAIHFPFILPELPDHPCSMEMEKKSFENPIKILHLTNHGGIDGTQHIVEAVNRLKEEGYPVELIIPRNVPYQELLRMYPRMDLSIGKLRMGYYANAQIESMSFGIPTMCYVREKFLKEIPDCPIINVRPENLYEKLKHYLDHKDELLAIGGKGPDFVKKYHSGSLLGKRLIELYQRVI